MVWACFKSFSVSGHGQQWGPPGVLGIWGEWLFIFRELGSTGNYFQGFGEQAQVIIKNHNRATNASGM